MLPPAGTEKVSRGSGLVAGTAAGRGAAAADDEPGAVTGIARRAAARADAATVRLLARTHPR